MGKKGSNSSEATGSVLTSSPLSLNKERFDELIANVSFALYVCMAVLFSFGGCSQSLKSRPNERPVQSRRHFLSLLLCHTQLLRSESL